MREINSTAELKKHIFESAMKDHVQAGTDEKGKFVLVRNFEDIALADANNKKNIGKGISFKVYQQGGKIAFPNGKEKLTSIKSENTEITEHIKLPEKDTVTRETLIKEINDSVRTCRLYMEQMNEANRTQDVAGYRGAKERLKSEVDKLDNRMLQLAAREKEENLYGAVLAITAINTARVEFDAALRQEMTLQHQKGQKEAEVRENPYAKHLKAMMEIKENLGNDELMGTLANVNGVVQKSGYGNETRANMASANAHQHEEGATAVRDGVSGPKHDTTYESLDVDDLLENGETNFSPNFYGAASREEDLDERNDREEKERTLFYNGN
jgi:hypothetical protein